MVDENAAVPSQATKTDADLAFNEEEAIATGSNLLTEFTSHVYLGQWECARACAITALRAPYISAEQKLFVREYIRGISESPAAFSTCANPLLLSPNHLSWLAAKFLEDHCNESKPSSLAHDAEFRVLLCTVGGELPDACRQELYDAYSAAAPGFDSDNSRTTLLSPQCLSSLQGLLLGDPTRAFLLLEHISQSLGNASRVVQQLWKVHFDALRSCLHQVQQAASAYEEVDDRHGSLLLNLIVTLPEPLVAHCAENPQWSDGLLDVIIGDLLDLIDGGLLSKTAVFESMVCRRSPSLSKLFAERENERRGRLAPAGSPQSLAVCPTSGDLDLQEAFLKSIVRGEHFLEAILNVAVNKLHSGESEAALKLFQHPVLRNFYITALVRAWNEVVSDDHACHVLKALDESKAVTWSNLEAEQLLEEMRYRLFVTECIVSLQRKRKTSLASPADIKARRHTVFGMLQHQSVLRVLHKTLGLGDLDRKSVFRLLGGHGRDGKNEKSAVATSSPVRQRDCALYRGYLTMQHVMNAFHSAIVLHHLGCSVTKLREADQSQEELQGDVNLGQYDSLADAVAMYGFGPVYKHAVLDELSRFEEEVGQVFPLIFRLELLENVFSLLFVTHVNLRRDATDDEDATDAEDDARSDEHHSSSHSPLELSLALDAHDGTESDEDTSRDIAETQATNSCATSGGHQPSAVKETSDSLSGKGSTASSNAGTRMATGCVGFLCPPFLVPDMLASLCTAVLATKLYNRAAQPLGGGGDSLSPEEEPPVTSSVSWEEFPSRLEELRKHVVEAQWRYDLVTSCEPPQQEEEAEGTPVPNTTSLDVLQGSPRGSPVLQQKTGRKPRKRRRRSSLALQRTDCTIIEKMLASFEALLKHCLWHGNYKMAGQVVQVLKLEGTHDAQELQFSRRLEEVTQNLASIVSPTSRSPLATSPTTISGPTTLVSQAVREGLHLTNATALVDRLLCSDGVPTIPEAELLIRSRSGSFTASSEGHAPATVAGGNAVGRNFVEEYGSGGPHVAAVADLALTADVPRDVAERLLALAVSKRETEASGNLHGRVPRLTTTLEALRRFLQEANEDDGVVGVVGCCSEAEEASLKALLVGYVDEFDAEKLRKQRVAWKQIEALYHKVRCLLDRHMPASLSSNSSSSGDEESRVELHRSFLQLSKATVSELRSELPFLPAVKFDFLRSVYAHARQLHKAIREASQQSKTKVARMSEDSYFWVLGQSPSALLARLVLREEVPPSRLESLAHQMKLSLANVLVHECCPRVLLKNRHQSGEAPSSPDFPQVLNDCSQSCSVDSSRHPNYVIKCLLKDLVKLMEVHIEGTDAAVTLSGASAVGRSEAFATWAEGCAALAHVDLSQLHRGVGQLAFFINLANVLTLHAALLQAASIPDDEMAETTFVPITSPYLHQRALQERQVAYRVGQLGVLTLFHIKRRLLFCDHQMDVIASDGVDPFLEMLISQEPPVKKEFAPHFHPKVVFALVQGRISDPKLEVIYPETIESQLQAAVDRCMAHIKAMTRQGVRMIIFPWQMHFFLATHMQLDESCEELRTSLQQIIPEDFVVEYQKEDSMFGVVLDGTLPLVASPDGGGNGLTSGGAKVPPSVLAYLDTHCPLLVRLLKFMLPKAPKSPQLEDGVKYRGLPLDNLLAHVYGLWMQLSTPQSHASWTSMALRGCSSSNVVWEALSGAAGQRDWISVLLIIEFVDALDGAVHEDLIFYRRCILSLLAASQPSREQESLESAIGPWTHAMRIKDLPLRSECVLAHYVRWPDVHARQTLETLQSECLYQGNMELHAKVSEELDRFNLYQEIADNIENDDQLCTWKDAALKSASEPLSVLQRLSDCSLYSIASRWSGLHAVRKECLSIATELKALHLLTQSPPNSSEAFKLTEGWNEDGEAFPLWQKVLDRLPNGLGKILLLDHLMDKYLQCLMDSELSSYQRLGIGLRMYTCIDSLKQPDYTSLVNDPALLLEQLLMNAEVDSVGRALEATADFLDDERSSFTRESANALLKTYASKALELLLLPSPSSEPDVASQPASSSSVKSSEGNAFTMPPRPPPESEWTPDAAVSCCMACHIEYFSMFSRRHHCRRCGRVVCSTCSQHSMVVEGFGQNKVRVCDDCFSQTAKLKNAEETASFSSDDQFHQGPMTDGGLRGHSGSASHLDTPRSASFSKPPLWVLTTNNEENAGVREHFYFERAPSVSLSLSILEKHSNLADCATFILSLCDGLFAVLAPKSTSESLVDYGLIITMLKSLIVRAKVKFLGAGISSGVACSDAYLRRLDIVRLIVNANCQHLLPEEMLVGTSTAPDGASNRRKLGRGLNSDPVPERKLRDRLMETERMALALEVSTKCGLETSGVFAAWGFALLRAGDWSSAREKFSHCLQKLKDRSNSSSESPLLKEIIDNLEKSHYPGISKAAAIFCAIGSLKSIKDPTVEVKYPVAELKGVVYSECKHYLEQYGSHRSMLSYLFRHGRVSQALEYYLAKGCETELFVEELLQPSLKQGSLDGLLDSLRQTEPSLQRWWPTLLAVCRNLQKRGRTHTLYALQLFMEDYLRAAVTSIQFYESPPAGSYSELQQRLRHLAEARKHLETYLSKYTTWEGHRANRTGTQVLAMAPKEVNRNVSQVNMQIDITRFLAARETERQGELLQPCLKDCPECVAPTLFSENTAKTDLACLVLVNGRNVEEGFGLAFRIIQENHVNGSLVFERAAQTLVSAKAVAQVERLVGCIQSCGYPDRYDTDAVVLVAIQELMRSEDEKKDLDLLVRCLKKDVNKVEAYMLAGRLKTAYLLAVRQNRTEHVKRIMALAEAAGQESVRAICEKRLQAMGSLA
ncbi:zinc finger FYVE-type containing 26 spastizin [Haemaphysalis longicornis]